MNITPEKICFKSLIDCRKGTIFSILSKSYENLIDNFPSYRSRLFNNWKTYEKEIFQFPSTVGKCGFLSLVNGNIVGFASWDPRKGPNVVIIGHNCILPQFRRKSYGKMQIIEIIQIFKEKNFKSIRVTTGDHDFFIPAQKMYESCGFFEVKRFKDPSNPFFHEIEFSKQLINNI